MSRQTSPALFFVLGSSTTLLAAVVALILAAHRWGALNVGFVLPGTQDKADWAGPSAAPWGTIEAAEIPLASPEGMFPDQSVRLQKSKWVFEGFTEEQLTRFLLSCHLDSIQKKVLLDRRFWSVESNGCVLTPPQPIIWYLKSASRNKIYSVLARSPSNYAQHLPFRFQPGRFEEFLEQSGLPARHTESIRRLAYENSGTTCFADLESVQAVLTAAEFEKLVEALYQLPAFDLRLRITPESDVDALVRYWGQGGRERLIKPLFRALSRVPGGASINVSFLLPPFARNRLYTFPASWNQPEAEREDCFYTAMNFFNDTPDTNFLDVTYIQGRFESGYAPVVGRPAYGDLVAVRDPARGIVHMCVYIAKDFVFTKNGVNRTQPWVLMRMSDMLTVYNARSSGDQLMFFRRHSSG